MKKIIIISLLLFCNITSASFFNKKEFELAVGATSTSINHKRGIITYGGYQVLPLLSVKLFNPDLLFAGSSLYYKLRLGSEKFLLRSRLTFNSTKDTPLTYTTEDEDERVRRDKTSELSLFLEYNFEDGHYILFESTKDLVAHSGEYFELKSRIALLDLKLQPGIFFAIGYGDSRHNLYLYGENAAGSGVNNIEYGIDITSPRAIENFWPVFKITRFELVGEDNKKASFVDETSGYAAQLLMAFRIY